MPPKFSTKLTNFRQPPPPFALKKTVFSPVGAAAFRVYLERLFSCFVKYTVEYSV